jgi:putative inorganic carbon (hco3(-)) transporter
MHQKSLTYYVVLLMAFFMPLLYFKTYLGPIPISAEVIFIPLLTLLAAYEYWKGKIELNDFKIWPLLLAFGVYFLIAAISLTQAVSVTPGIMEIARYLSYVVMFVIVSKVNFTKAQYKSFGIAFLASITIVGLFGVLQYVFNFSLNKAGLYALDEAIGRVDSTLINPNYYSAFLNFVIPAILLFSVLYFKDKKYQLLMFALYGVFIVNLILTYTRAAWLTMACALILTIIIIPKQFIKNVIKPHILIAFLVLFTGVYFMPDVQERTSSALYALERLLPSGSDHEKPPSDDGDDSVEDGSEEDDENNEDKEKEDETTNRAVVSRTTLWKTGFYMMKDNPILGIGSGNYRERYYEYVTKYPELYIGHDDSYSVHNSYLKVGAENGVTGLIAFLAIYIVYLLKIAKLHFKQTTTLGKTLSVGLFVGSVCYLVQNLSNNLIFIPQLNVIFWLIGGVVLSYLYKISKK